MSLGPATCCGEAEVSNGRPGVGNNDAVALGYILAEAEQVFVGVGGMPYPFGRGESDGGISRSFPLEIVLGQP